jgi:ABC-2 type transport system ATP-binding protein
MRACLLPLAVTAAALVPATASHAEPVQPRPGIHDFATTDAIVPVVDGPTDDHAATIDTRLYVPDNASPATPQPAVLITHGFGLSKNAPEVVANATFLARHGYVVLTYTAQGFGASSGCVTLQSRTYDVKDAQQIVTALLDPRPDVLRDDKGPLVGMVGGSYGGGIQLNLAQADERIRAIVPGRTWNSLQYSLDPNNRIAPGDPTGFSHQAAEQGVFKAQWTSLFFASGNTNPATGAGGCPQDKVTSGDPATVLGLPCLGFNLEVCRTYATVSTTGDASEADRALLADASGATQIDRLRVPTLLVQGQSDTLFNLNDAVATYSALRRNGVPVKMIWNSGGHGGYNSLPGECEVYGGGTGGEDFRGLDDCYLTLRTLAFLDEALRGTPDPSPGFTFFRDWVPYDGAGAADEQYGAAPAFPAMPSTTFALSGSSELAAPGVPAVEGTASFLNPPGGVPPAYSETSNFTGPDSSPRVPLPPTEQPGQSVSFTSAPFAADLDSVGIPSARLQLSHAAPTDLVLFGKVFDVAPDGSATLIRRLVAPVRVPAGEVGEPVSMNLLGFAHRFAAGHAVRLTLAATDAAYFNARLPDQITVTTGPGSTFSLPGVLPPAAAPTPVAVAAPAPVAAAGPGTARQSPARAGMLAATGPSALLETTGWLGTGWVGTALLGTAWAVRRRRTP